MVGFCFVYGMNERGINFSIIVKHWLDFYYALSVSATLSHFFPYGRRYLFHATIIAHVRSLCLPMQTARSRGSLLPSA
jgi:hypothetical protein